MVFITFRTADSIPKDVLQRWEREKSEWMRQQARITYQHWKLALPTLGVDLQLKFRKHFDRCREDTLDSCHGKCVLRDPELARIVADSVRWSETSVN